MSTPNDLKSLPTTPYDVRPDEIPLDVEECRTALWITRGNISAAAKKIRVSARRFRVFVKNSKRLTSEMEEIGEQLVDIAEDNAYDALMDGEDPGRRDSMTRFILKGKGKVRGHGSDKGGVTIKNTGNMVISWENGEALSNNDDGLLIEGNQVTNDG